MNNSSWIQNCLLYLDKRAITMLLLGFSAGLPILLIFSSLSLWLREAGVARSAVTYFSWAALGYSFKFIWAPLVDKLPLPLLSSVLGRRRGWLLFSQIMIVLAISWMALVDPSSAGSLTYMAMAAVLLGFSSATQDIVIDAYRIESAPSSLQVILSATYIAGYRLGMIAAGAGSLYLAASLGSSKEIYSYVAWKQTYLIMAACMLVGILTSLFRPEPDAGENVKHHASKDHLVFFGLFLVSVSSFVFVFNGVGPYIEPLKSSLSEISNNTVLAGFLVGALQLSISLFLSCLVAFVIGKIKLVNMEMIEEAYVDPIKNFFMRYGKGFSIWLLLLIGLYRISDIVLGVISSVFYHDMGFDKLEIASAVKTFGVFMSILGGFIGGALSLRLGVVKMLWWGAFFAAATNLLFLILAGMGDNILMLYLVISADNLVAGFASAAFVAFLSSLTDISFTAVQYAIFSSLMTLLPKVLGGYSGSIVDSLGYEWFFIFTTLIGLPILLLVRICSKKFKVCEG